MRKVNTLGFFEICSLGFCRLFRCLRKIYLLLKWHKWDTYGMKSARIQKRHRICSIDSSGVLCDCRSIWAFRGTKYFMFHIFMSLLCFSWWFRESTVISYIFSYKTFANFFESVAFTRIATCLEQEIYFRIIATSPRYLLRKVWISVLWILHFVVLYFFQKRFEGMSRNNPTKKQIGAEIQAKLNHAPAQKPAEEKML